MKRFADAIKRNIFGIVLVVFAVSVGTYSLFFDNDSQTAVVGGTCEKTDEIQLSETSEPETVSSEEIQTETEAEPEVEPETESFADASVSSCDYFHTPSGKKWHLDENCRYLKNSKTILKSTYEEVCALGLDACSACGTQNP